MTIFDYPAFEVLYQDAFRLEDYTTRKFWMHLFNKIVFPGLDWIVASKQPHRDLNDLCRIDVEVDHVEGSHVTVIIFAELQKIHASPHDVKEAQEQVKTGCQSYCEQNQRSRVGTDLPWPEFSPMGI